jgi:hypothetical protein
MLVCLKVFCVHLKEGYDVYSFYFIAAAKHGNKQKGCVT